MKITLASLTLHNFLRTVRSNTYVVPRLTDWENEAHELVEGTWMKEGLGTALLPLPPVQARNSPLTAKELREVLKKYCVSPAGQVPWQEDFI